MKRHILVIGQTGQLARALISHAAHYHVHITSFDRKACDLSQNKDDIYKFAKGLPNCDGIIIAAAYTAVDAAENDEAVAFQVNSVAPGVFADICSQRNIPLIHISSDYVFAGKDNDQSKALVPHRPNMPTEPINAYGRSKLEGERQIINSAARAVIIRSSWVFDGIGKNFLTTMLRLGQMRDELKVVDDQFGRPTYAGHLAQACMTALNTLINDSDMQGGIYHFTGAGRIVSWAGFAESIFTATSHMRDHDITITPVLSSEYPMVARRPRYSVLEIGDFERDFAMVIPDWEDGLKAAIDEWRGVRF